MQKDKTTKNTDTQDIHDRHRWNRKWKLLTSALSVCVAVGVIALLMLPAITLNNPSCGMTEHVHGADCYSTSTEKTLICEYTESWMPTYTQTTPSAFMWPGNNRHRHTADCYAETETSVLICELEEHTHTDACFAAEEKPEDKKLAEGVFEFITDEYVTTVIASAEANLPEDTVINAESIFDSDEPAVAAFSLFGEESIEEDSSIYVEEIMEEITWGEVTRIKLFDITLTSGDEEVQPSVPVEVRTEFTEPLALGSDEEVYGVHFGESGLEILPVTTELNEDGSIVSITHTQSSFSKTGYVLVHTTNENDIGPDVLPVHYCIWVNDQWIIAGSTRTGWYGDYYEGSNDNGKRDYITLDQMLSVLRPYGLEADTEEALHTLINDTVWYQRAEDANTIIRHSTTPEKKDVDGDGVEEEIYYLSGNLVKDDGYHIYYTPGGTKNETKTEYSRNRELGADLMEASKFYTLKVRDMNNIVYKEGETLPETVIAQYDTPVQMTVKKNIDSNGNNKGWQWVNNQGGAIPGITAVDDSRYPGLFGYKDNGDTETYSLRGIRGRTTLIPYANAVEDAETNTECKIDLMVHLDGEWQNVGPISLQYRRDDICNGEWFITAGQLYSYLEDFGFLASGYNPDDETQNYRKFTYALGRFDDLMAKAEDTPMTICGNNKKIDETTYAVGLGQATPTDMTLFYLPGSDNETAAEVQGVGFKAYSESEKIKGDRIFSIKVVDDYQLVYYGTETDNFNVYVQEGNGATVSVQNNLSVLWSIRELWENDPDHPNYVPCKYTASQADNFNTYAFEEIYGPIQIEASSLNPNYTVQYYADIVTYDLYEESGNDTLEIINTAGKKLPTNDTVSLPSLYLQLNETNLTSTENNGTQSPKYEVKRDVKSQEIYKEKSFQYDTANLWKNIDKLWNNTSYEIVRVCILKDGRNPESQAPDDWWLYNCRDNGANITFTNLASEENAPHKEGQNDLPADRDYKILLTEGMIIRLHYTLVEGSSQVENVKFFDYDITAGGSSPYDSGIEGINARANFPGTNFGNGGDNIQNIYAFGNTNCGTGLAGASLDGGIYINKANGKTTTYKGCAFGLVQNNLKNGALQWNVNAPDIFNEQGTTTRGTATGRHDYDGTLTFKKWGDVYVLTAADSGVGSRTDLEYFFHPSPDGSHFYDGDISSPNIFTNNFWIVDNATKKADPKWGKSGNNVNFSSRSDSAGKDTLGGRTHTGNFPVSDDGQAHNSFFGMKYAVDFSISEDYVGPLSYVFFGDDDMWVFLDGQLVCDIGGVHSSVGEYVNLRDYLPVDGENTEGDHTLTFYYTERGSSGSTCWMSFTLPSMTSSIVEEGTSQIKISKELQNQGGDSIESNEEYEFVVQLYKDSTKQDIINTAFSLRIDKADGTTEYYSVATGQNILIGAGDTAWILGVPIGTYYMIEEKPDARFDVIANDQEGYVVEGTTELGVNSASFVNIQKGGPKLPETGGSGTTPYVLGGLALITIACAMFVISKRKQQRGND